MKLHVIHTGSAGNSYLVEYLPNWFLMLDCGVPEEMIKNYMNKLKLPMSRIKAILISHLHGDHLESSNVVNTYSIPIFLPKDNQTTNLAVNEIRSNLKTVVGFELQKQFNVNPFIDVVPFLVPHDSYNLGYKIHIKTKEPKTIVYMTDFGNIRTLPYFEDKVDLYLIECNYDDERIALHDNLRNRRSLSDTGHCSNTDTFRYLSHQPNIKNANVVLIHGSSENISWKDGDYKIFEKLECKNWNVAKKNTIYNF